MCRQAIQTAAIVMMIAVQAMYARAIIAITTSANITLLRIVVMETGCVTTRCFCIYHCRPTFFYCRMPAQKIAAQTIHWLMK
jgi:hypothetical protein